MAVSSDEEDSDDEFEMKLDRNKIEDDEEPFFGFDVSL